MATPPQGCNIPAGFGPLPSGGAAAGKAVFACPRPDGTFNIFSVVDNSPVMSAVSRDCVAGFGDVTFKNAEDAPCGAQPAAAPGTIPTTQTPATQQPQSVISNPGAKALTYPIQNLWFPESLEAPPIQPVSGPPVQSYAPMPGQPSPPVPAPAAAAPPPPHVPGTPYPVTDWFGLICAKKAAP